MPKKYKTTTRTPQKESWVSKPAGDQNGSSPSGLEHLADTDKLLINQMVDLLPSIIGWDHMSKFGIYNQQGELRYFAFEDSNICMKLWCAKQRRFEMFIVDHENQKVMKLFRPFRCFAGSCWCAGCCDCAAHEIMIEAPINQPIGSFRQLSSGWGPKFGVFDENREQVLLVDGPCCLCSASCNKGSAEFHITSVNKSIDVGTISKSRDNLVKRLFHDMQTFSVEYKKETDVKTKALILAAAFLIDFVYYEKQGHP